MPDAFPGGDDSPTLSLVLRVDETCTRFERAWRACKEGPRPQIEDYVANVPDAELLAYLRALVPLDMDYRRRAREEVRAEDYYPRFPTLDPVWLADILSGRPSVEALATSSDSNPCPASGPEETRPQRGSAPEPPIPPGLILGGRYELFDEVNEGGMGVVYRARHCILGKPVAIKILRRGGNLERFLREAQLMARINSPYVVTVHDYDVLSDSRPLLVMEWIEGCDLGKVLKRYAGPIPEAMAIPWMRQTCQGMLAAADQGIIHRDLKPSNIMIDSHDRARVTDFGLARGPNSPGDMSKTGLVMGTVAYMAPEQAEDPRGVDKRADIYSFGATFYHALTGMPPFAGPTEFAVLLKHKNEPLISPKSRNPAISDLTSELLERCLAKAPQDRFPSFAEVLKHLRPAHYSSSPWDVSDDSEIVPYLERYQARRKAYLSGGLKWKEADTYEFPRGQVLRIVRGTILDQPVEALVSSDNDHLSMHAGVALALRRAAGGRYAEEARRLVPVRPGRAVVTSAGDLRARFVFHGVTRGLLQDHWVRPSRDIISEVMTSCFYQADCLCVQSLAFPLFGTGTGTITYNVCLDTMFQFLARTFLRGLTSVREARIVLFD